MENDQPASLSALIAEVRAGGIDARERLVGIIYAELHRMATGRMRGDEFSGIALSRRHGARDFLAREIAIVRELHAELARAIGGSLARYADPSPRALSPRARQVLTWLLDGEGDKQIAARLNLSRFTVNHYAKLIFRHFQTTGRAELQGRWIRRGWGAESPGRTPKM
jgi:DNA-binding NarL/FixJ family response regulator